MVAFLIEYKDRYDRREISGSTIQNYVKVAKLLCEMNDIAIPWKKITRGLPKGRQWADDRAPSMDEIRKLCEYPDRRIKPLVYTMCSSGIRLGAWDYLHWRDVSPIYNRIRQISNPDTWLCALCNWRTVSKSKKNRKKNHRKLSKRRAMQ